VDNGNAFDLLTFAMFSNAQPPTPGAHLNMTAQPWRSRATSISNHPLITAAMMVLIAALSAVFAVPVTAAPAPGQSSSAGVGTYNDNPIDWTVVDWFVNHQGAGFPLRVGQHDDGTDDGFGERHIIDGHGFVPPYEDILAAVSVPGHCQYNYWDQRWRCQDPESLLFVVYTLQIDDRSGDDLPFGIITAYYVLPPIECSSPLTGDVTVQCGAEPLETSIDYRGPDQAVNGADLEVSARLGDDLGVPKTDQPLTFSLGTGDDRQTCEGTTSGAGVATCTITNVDQPASASVPLTIDYAGNQILQPSSTTVDLTLQTPTKIAYTGPEFIANGESATLAARLTDYQDRPVTGRSVALSIGEGGNAQSCTGITNAEGDASCLIAAVNQPLNDTATVPAAAVFSGDSAYLGSNDAATVKLEYYTGRAYGLQANVNLLVLPVDLPPQPDTGEIRTAAAMNTDVPCTAAVNAIVLDAEAVCAEVATTLAPGTVTATSSVEQASIGLPGLPVIDIAGLTTTATGTCDALTGSTSLTLTIGGIATPVRATPNTVIDVAAGVRLTINEQVRSDNGITVTGVRLSVDGTDTEIVLGYSTAAVHHCAP
jgi:hypothetical protein